MADTTLPDVPIRDAAAADLDDICDLIRDLAEYEQLGHEVEFDRDELDRNLFGDEPVARVLIAESADGAVAGFALWFSTFSTFLGRPGIWLEDLFVRPEFRGQGFGLGLLQHLRTLTEDRIEWNVLDWNEPSIRFYQAIGAEPVAGWTRYRWLPDRGR
ncbi:MAG: hypothetical protein QOG64_145 [Acidimicrobiaceae bacterium]|nr:hypothetical protein [Acidimicrobiaceae bacterium]